MDLKINVTKGYAKDIRDQMQAFQKLEAQTFLPGDFPSGLTGEGVRVCLVGTGVVEHKSMKSVSAGVNLGKSRHSRDNEGNAHVLAGLIAAADKNNIVGLSPDVTMLYAKVSDDAGTATDQSIAAGLLWAVVVGAHVAVVPHAVDYASTPVEAVLQKCKERRVLVVSVPPLPETARPEQLFFTDEFVMRETPNELASIFTDNRYVVLQQRDVGVGLLAGVVSLLTEESNKSAERGKRAENVRARLQSLNGSG